jgi:hypothetical protein
LVLSDNRTLAAIIISFKKEYKFATLSYFLPAQQSVKLALAHLHMNLAGSTKLPAEPSDIQVISLSIFISTYFCARYSNAAHLSQSAIVLKKK